ncbi:16S rRNA (cytidine(1402)-2'-O)-methyltransferase, partial [Bifidobacterium pseudocatenulatum]|nr:16S rRNA (cytidine(1402)-2'-O)-methyltransferase [Bifidobacterium pseudocatenulatum]
MADSQTAAEQSVTEQSGTGLDALVFGTDVPQGTVVMAATPIVNTADASARLI